MKNFDVKKLRYWLFVTLLITAPFSKYPSVATPLFNFSSFRIGLYPVLSLIFVFACLRPTFKAIPALYKHSKTALISIAILVLVGSLGVTMSLYKARSELLIDSILLLLALVLTSWWYVAHELKATKYKQILKIMLIAGCIWGGVAIVQFALAGFSNSTLGLQCKGCGSQVFGFPRISGFAAEPQFFANSLLIYFFVALGVFYKSRSRLAMSAALLTLVGIGLTFSRGAFLALGLGVFVYFILLRMQGHIRVRTLAKHASVVVLAVVLVAALFVGAASWRYRSTPDIAYKTFRSLVQQGSLGLIKLPASTSENGTFKPAGLVQASGQDRLAAARLSMHAWQYNTFTRLFGVGAGNLGPFVNKHLDANAPNNLTVYVFYILLLAEFGIIGLGAFLVLHIYALKTFISSIWRHKDAPVYTALFCLGIAFLIQYCFFGTYINVPYVWLWFGVLLGLGTKGVKEL